ncbi:MAG TPA: biotin/lipoyl-binding protein [Chthoniobacterales bacterium]
MIRIPAGKVRRERCESPATSERASVRAWFVCVKGTTLQLWPEHVSSRDYARVERNAYPIGSKVEGTITKTFVSNGQMVKPGDLLVEMDRKQAATLGQVMDRVHRDQDLSKATTAMLHMAEATVEWTNRQFEYTRVYAAATGRVVFDKSKVAQHLQSGAGSTVGGRPASALGIGGGHHRVRWQQLPRFRGMFRPWAAGFGGTDPA